MLDLYFWRGFYIHDHLNMSQSIPPASKYDDLQSLKSTEIHQKERCFSFHVSIAFLAETSCSYRVFIRRNHHSQVGGPMIHREIVPIYIFPSWAIWWLESFWQHTVVFCSCTISPLTLMCDFEKLWFFSPGFFHFWWHPVVVTPHLRVLKHLHGLVPFHHCDQGHMTPCRGS